MLVNSRTVRIEWGDCDPAGIVYFPRYFVIMDNCTAHLFERATGITKIQMQKKYEFAGFPMVDIRAKFHVPTRYGDDVVVESRIAEFGKSRFEVLHRLSNRDGQLCVEGFETRVWVGRHPEDPSRIKSKPIPDELVKLFGAPVRDSGG
jgi:4-hydroxybenzoyl-CoA thioesterase